jgi:ABC-type uncharacterized transport system substrate-binding protein
MPTLFRLLLTVVLLFAACPGSFAGSEPYRFVLLKPSFYSEYSISLERILSALESRGFEGRYRLKSEDIYIPEKEDSTEELAALAEKIMARDDVDLIFSMGTTATQALLKANNLKTPIIGITISEPLETGIIKSRDLTGTPNLAIRYIPDRGIKMFRIFHEVSTFSRMGIIYENTVEGRSYANLQDAREAGRDRGFAVIEYKSYEPDYPLASCEAAVNELIEKKINAIYLSEISCFDTEKHDISSMLQKLHDNKILTFTSSGASHVAEGVFFGLSTITEQTLGNFYAHMIIEILEQKIVPGNIPIVAEFNPEIVLNLQAATALGINLPLWILVSADKIFDNPIYCPEQPVQGKPGGIGKSRPGDNG